VISRSAFGRLPYPNAALPAGSPPLEQLSTLLQHFVDAHDWSIQFAVRIAFYDRGDLERFDFQKKCPIFKLSYRPDCRGNPAAAFTIDFGFFKSVDDLIQTNSQHLEVLEAGRPMREAADAQYRLTDADYVGLLRVCWFTPGYVFWEALPVYRDPPQANATHDQMLCKFWLLNFQTVTSRGHVYGQLKPTDDFRKLGEFRKEGSRWQWVAFTPQELVALRYPADHEVPD